MRTTIEETGAIDRLFLGVCQQSHTNHSCDIRMDCWYGSFYRQERHKKGANNMPATAGIGGNVRVGATPTIVANVGVWSVTAKVAVASTTSFGATGAWETQLPTIKSWTAKCDGRTDPADTLGQLTLLNGLGTIMNVEFDVDGTHHWSGSAILTGIDPKADTKGLNDIAFSFDGTGPLVFV